MKRTKLACLTLLVAIGGVLLIPAVTPTDACAPAPRIGTWVQIANESAIIVWDEKTQTQHFIRRATFETNSEDFGFLVPTPGTPTLTEAKDSAFDTLKEYTKPEVIKKKRKSSGGGCAIGCGARDAKKSDASKGGAKPAVRVLNQERVAGYDITTVEADDAKKLADWLKKNEYPFSPELTEWVKPYIEQKWKITAFKIAPPEEKGEGGTETENDSEEVGASAVRMSFKTDRPVFPYREPKPAEKKEGEEEPYGYQRRLLRVYLLSDSRMKGTLDHETEKFPGKTVWAKPLTSDQREKTLSELNIDQEGLPETLWLTEIEDHSSPRPGVADVFFSTDDDQDELEREPDIHYVRTEQSGETLWTSLVAVCVFSLVFSRVRKL